jgi:Cellulase (glycosyl hydrolase family 5)
LPSHHESSDRPSDKLTGQHNCENIDVMQLYMNAPDISDRRHPGNPLPDSIGFATASNPYGNSAAAQSEIFKKTSSGHMDLDDFTGAENKLMTGSASNDVTEHVKAYHDGGYWKPIYARIDTQQKSIWTSVKDHTLSEADFQKLESNEQKIETLKAKLESDGSMSPKDRDILNKAIDANWSEYKRDNAPGSHPTDNGKPPSSTGSNSGGDTGPGSSPGGDTGTSSAPGGDTGPGSNPGGANTDGQFTIKNGQIIGPDGNTFIAKGIAVNAGSAVQDEETILKYFPKVNTIRLVTGLDGNTYTGYNKTPAEVAQETQKFIDDMTKRGIVVEIDDHQPGDRHLPATGAALATEEQWYANLAQANKNNPYVWFQTPNEPVPGNDKNFVNDAVAEEKGIYNAIRATGNNNIVVAEMASNYSADKITSDPAVFSQYSNMENVVFDYHLYDKNPDFIKKRLASTAPITDTQGVIPAIIGEYGNTDGGGTIVTAAGDANLKAVQSSGLGNIAWAFHNGTAKTDANRLLDSNGQLTDYGQEVANYINGS